MALDGASGPELDAAARALLRKLPPESRAGISFWGASNVFAELDLDGPEIPMPSPRSLVLFYIADLAFRVRWEIRPALEKGRTVIAAPYVFTAIAFGKATGLLPRWLLELLRFVPRPDDTYRVAAVAASERPRDGFLAFCCAVLARDNPPWDIATLRRDFDRCCDAMERRRVCRRFSEDSLSGAFAAR